MEQDKFEELIKPYAKKIVDDENPQLVKYKILPSATKRRSLQLPDVIAEQNPTQKKRTYENYGTKVKTPDGVFNSMRLAAAYYDVTYQTVRLRCIKNLHGWSFYNE
jgi:hypothetical protein